MRISVAVTNYNYGRYLSGALESLFQQTRVADEIVVVDDGSTDISRELLAACSGRVTVVLQDNAGQAAATNTAVGACTGDVVVLLDSDDLALPTRLAQLELAYQQHPGAGWVWHQLEHIDRETGLPTGKPVIQQGFTAGLHDHRAEVQRGRLPMSAPATSALSWRRTLLQRCMPVPTGVRAHDNFLKMVTLGLAPGMVIDEVLTLQGIHDSNVYTGVDPREQRKLAARDAIEMLRGLEGIAPEMNSLGNRLAAEGFARSSFGSKLTQSQRSELRRYAKTLTTQRQAQLVGQLAVAIARVSVEAARRRRKRPSGL